MPFYGPFDLGSGGLTQDQLNTFGANLRRQYPGITGVTTYPGAPGMTAGLGFTHPGPLLFPGQAPSSTSPIQASPPSTIGGPGAFAPFESLTALLSSGGTGPAGTVPSVTPSPLAAGSVSPGGEGDTGSAPAAAPSAPTGAEGVAAGLGGLGSAGVAGVVSGISTPGHGIPGIPGFGLGSPTTGSTIGSAVGTVAGLGLGIPGLGILGSGLGGVIGQMVSNAKAEADTAAAIAQGVPAGSLGFTGQGGTSGAPSGAGPGGAGSGGVPGGEGSAPGGAAPAAPTGVVGIVGGFGDVSPTTAADANAPGPTGPPGSTGGEGPPGGEGSPGGAGGTGAGGGATVICTELYRQGRMPQAIWEADRAFGRQLDPAIYAGYYRWAPTMARWMRQSRIVTALIRVPAMAWAYEMARVMGVPGARGSLLGKFVMHIGGAVCRMLGRRAVLAHAR